MKLNLKPFYIVIISEKVLNIVGYMSGVGNTAKGAAFFPFMMVRSKEYMQPWLINHELIHFRQQIETLIIGSIILNFCEKMYGMFVLRKTQK